jgi:hypothetical protein
MNTPIAAAPPPAAAAAAQQQREDRDIARHLGPAVINRMAAHDVAQFVGNHALNLKSRRRLVDQARMDIDRLPPGHESVNRGSLTSTISTFFGSSPAARTNGADISRSNASVSASRSTDCAAAGVVANRHAATVVMERKAEASAERRDMLGTT